MREETKGSSGGGFTDELVAVAVRKAWIMCQFERSSCPRITEGW